MGKTARDLLTEQLTILDDQLKEVVANVARDDAEALLANAEFAMYLAKQHKTGFAFIHER